MFKIILRDFFFSENMLSCRTNTIIEYLIKLRFFMQYENYTLTGFYTFIQNITDIPFILRVNLGNKILFCFHMFILDKRIY